MFYRLCVVSMRLLVVSVLLEITRQAAGMVIFPDPNLMGDPLIWKDGKPPRIQHPETCRSRPPILRNSNADAGTAVYILAYLRGNTCRYAAFDSQQSENYELTVAKGSTSYDENACRPGVSFNGERICLMNGITSDYVVIFCVVDEKTIVGHLMFLTHKNKRYILSGLMSYTWDKYNSVSTKHFLALLRYPVDNSILLAANNPSFMIHILFPVGQPPKIAAWKGGPGNAGENEVRKYYQNTFHKSPLNFTNCPYASNDEKFCSYTGSDSVSPVEGAFNQFQCMRIRRGLVHYDASAQMVTEESDDDSYGFIVEWFGPAGNVHDSCFYSPDYKANNLVAVWTKDQNNDLCQKMLNMKPIEGALIANGTLCQTAVFPVEAKGKFRIVGMEPNNAGIPQIAIYNGVDPNPEYIGDPDNLLRYNCYVEENRISTAFAHFGVRPIDYSHFVIFCNRLYGPRADFTEQDLDRGATLIFYEYDPAAKIMSALTHRSFRTVADSQSFNRFLDHRGVIVLRSDNKIFFVQIMPCVVVTLDLAGEEPVFEARPPNARINYVCRESDLSEVVSAVGVAANELLKCKRTTCVYKAEDKTVHATGDHYEPDNYFTVDIFGEYTSLPVGGSECLRSSYDSVVLDGEQRWVFKFEATTPGEPYRCFAPNEKSAGFQILSEDKSAEFCEDPFPYSGTITRTPTTTTAKPTPRTTTKRADIEECISPYTVDTYPAVAFAALFFLICASAFGAVIAASIIGKRHYRAERKRRSEKGEDWRRIPTYVPTQTFVTETGATTAGTAATTAATTNQPDATATTANTHPSAPEYIQPVTPAPPEYVAPQLGDPNPANSIFGPSVLAGTASMKPEESSAAKPDSVMEPSKSSAA